MKLTTELYSEYTLPKDIFSELKKIVDFDENNHISYNSELAGNIEKEFKISKIDKRIVKFFEKYATKFYIENICNDDCKDYEIKLTSIWINKQKKYEFNPLHNHRGVVSFVCWIVIPYFVENELNLDNCKYSNNSKNSLFEFVYVDNYGKICVCPINVDKSHEGKCIFFNSELNHQVYPFYTSEDYRISVSGNFDILIKKLNNKLIYK